MKYFNYVGFRIFKLIRKYDDFCLFYDDSNTIIEFYKRIRQKHLNNVKKIYFSTSFLTLFFGFKKLKYDSKEGNNHIYLLKIHDGKHTKVLFCNETLVYFFNYIPKTIYFKTIKKLKS